MSTKTWFGGTGDWDTALDWSGDAAPGSADSALINAGTVDISATDPGIDVGSISLASGATLAISDPGRTQTVVGALSNSGTLAIDTSGSGGSALDVDGVLTNTGTGAQGLLIGNADLASATSVEVGGLSNSGAISILGGAVTAAATLTVGGSSTDSSAIVMNAFGDLVVSGSLSLQGTSVTGGTLATSRGGTIGNTGGNITTLSGVTIASGTIYVDNSNLQLSGAIDVEGSIDVGATGAATLTIASAGATLSGGGAVVLFNSANTALTDGALVNAAVTITGGGEISGLTSFDNQAGGVVEADQTNALVYYYQAAATNEGTVEATNGATLSLDGTTMKQYGAGKIEANGSKSVVELYAGGIVGGTISTSGGGVVQSINGALTSLAIAAGSTVAANGGNSLTLSGTIVNEGQIDVGNSAKNGAIIVASAGVTLKGGGAIVLSNNSSNSIAGSGTLVNVDDTIAGAGEIAQLASFDNQSGAMVDADDSTALTIYYQANATNEGIVEATNAGTFNIDGTTLTQRGAGQVEANGSKSVVELYAGGIVGGTISTTGGGVVQSISGALTSLAIAAGSTVAAIGGNSLTLSGTIVNEGQIDVGNSTTNGSIDVASAGVTLTGGGAVVLSNNSNNSIAGSGAFVNVDDRIAGAGEITQLASFGNQFGATVDADDSTALTLYYQANATNEGIVEATNAGTFNIDGTTLTQHGEGQVEADGSKSVVELYAGGIVGGTIYTTGGGVVQSTGGGALTSLTIAAGSTVAANGGNSLTLSGAIVNEGQIDLGNSTTSGSINVASAGVTLAGGGAVVLSNNSNNSIAGSGALVDADDTIEGAGQITQLASFDNQSGATVDATGADALALDLNTFVSNGVLESSNPNGLTKVGGLSVAGGAVTGSGVFEISGGGLVNLQTSTAENVMFGAGGGTFEIGSSGAYSGAVTGFAAGDAIELQLPGLSGGDSYETNYVQNGAGGVLSVDLIESGPINKGPVWSVNLAGVYSNSLFAIASSANGWQITYSSPAASASSWNDAAGGSWQTAADWTPTGAPAANANVTIGVAGTYTVTDSQSSTIVDSLDLSDGGATLVIASGATFSINGGAGAGDLAGVIDVDAGASLDVTGVVEATGDGGISALGSGATVDVDAARLEDGNLDLAAHAVLEATGGSSTFADMTIADAGKAEATAGVALYLIDSSLTVESGGSASDLTLMTGAAETVDSGASDSDAQISEGTQFVYGAASGAVISSGGVEVVESTGSASSATVNSGGELILDDALATSALSVYANNGGLIEINGKLTNTGQTLTVGAGATLGDFALGSSGDIVGGVIADKGGGLKIEGGTLDGLTYEGAINVGAGATLDIVDGLTAEGTGGAGGGIVNLTAAGATLAFSGAQIFDDATVNIGSASGDTLGTTGAIGDVLTLGSKLIIDVAGASATLDADGGGIVNQGDIDDSLSSDALTITGANFVNKGAITVAKGATLHVEGDLVNAAGGDLTVESGGTLTLGGGILDGAAGSVSIADDAIVSGRGTLSGAISNSGDVAAEGGTLLVNGSVVGSGQFAIEAGANLVIGSAFTQTVNFAGNNDDATLTLDAPGSFTGAINGFAYGDSIDFADIQLTGVKLNGATLVATASNGSTYDLSGLPTDGSYIVQSDGHGGSELALQTQLPWSAFYSTLNTFQAAKSSGAVTSEFNLDLAGVFSAAMTGAIGTMGGATWQTGYQNSASAANNVSNDIAGGASTLNHSLTLFGSIVSGAVGGVVENGSLSSYGAIAQEVNALAAQIEAGASATQLQTDVANVYDALAGSAVSNAAWRQAETASDQAVATLATDIANSAGAAQIQSDSANLYSSIVSGSLNAVGGASLQQAYGAGPTVLQLNTAIAGGASPMQIQSDVAGVYDDVISATPSPSSDPAAPLTYKDTVAAANQLAAADIGGASSERLGNEAATLSMFSGSSAVGASGGAVAEEAFDNFMKTADPLIVDLETGDTPLSTIESLEAELVAFLIGPSGDTEQQNLTAYLAANSGTLENGISQGGVASANAINQIDVEGLAMMGALDATVSPAADDEIATAAADVTSDSASGNIGATLGAFGSLLAAESSAAGGPDGAGGTGYTVLTTVSTFLGITNGLANNPLNGSQNGEPWGSLEEYGLVSAGFALGGLLALGGVVSLPIILGGFTVIAVVDAVYQYTERRSQGQNLAQSLTPNIVNYTNAQSYFNHVNAVCIPGGGNGDVHLTTFDGLHYNFMGAGEFVLTKSTLSGDPFQVQIRLQPWNGSAAVTVTTMLAVQVGTDRVTFGIGRDDVVWIDGHASTISAANPVINLNGGQLTQLSSGNWQVNWDTGESMTIGDYGEYFNYSIMAGPFDTDALQGLLGPDNGDASTDLQLSNGTVLGDSLSSSEEYGEYANSWRLTQDDSLMDYTPGQTTATFTDTSFPGQPFALEYLAAAAGGAAAAAAESTNAPQSADLVAAAFASDTSSPNNIFQAAAAAVAAAGITNPDFIADAELDYIATGGDDSFIASAAAAAAAETGQTTTAANIASPAPTALLGVLGASSTVTESKGAVTPVTFDAYLLGGAAVNDIVVDFSVASGFFNSAFGGSLPSGSVTIAAGASEAQFTVDLPTDALGAEPSETLAVDISSPDSTPIFVGSAQTKILNSQPEPGPSADPVLEDLGGGGVLTANGDDYTLNLGVVPEGAQPSIRFGVVNAAATGADELGGTFTVGSGNSVSFSGDGPLTPLAPGDVYENLVATVATGVLGANSQKLTFTPQDLNATGYSATLPAETLTVDYTVALPADGVIDSPTTIAFANKRVGTTEDQAVSITNGANLSGAPLDATVSTIGDAIASGAISELAPGATDDTDLTAGLNTSAAGAQSGSVVIDFYSDNGSGSETVANIGVISVSGSVYRPGAASFAGFIAHVGDPTTQNLTVTNIDPADGYSENLIASVVGSSGAVTVSGTTTGEVAAGDSSKAISLSYSTATASVLGSVTLGLVSDGGVGAGSIDGLGTLGLGDKTLSVTVDNYAKAAFEEISGGGSLTQTGDDYTLNLGTIVLDSSPVTINLGALNAAAGPSDALSGSFSTSGDEEFSNSGFAAFSGLGAGQADTAPTVTLATSTAGTFSETITLDSTGSNASGYSGALAPEILTIKGKVGAEPSVTFSAAPTQFNGVEPTIITGSDAEVGGTIKTVDVFNGSTDLGAATLNANGTWSLETTLAAGSYKTLKAVATDASGATATADAPYSLNAGLTGLAYQAVEKNLDSDSNVIGSEYFFTHTSGEPYSYYQDNYGPGNVFLGAQYYFNNVTKELYTSYEYDTAPGGELIASKFFYTDVSGEPYTGYEYDYNGAGVATRAVFTGISSEPYSSYEYDWVGGAYAGAEFTFTNVAAGASYSSYVVDESNTNTFSGEQFYFTDVPGQPYSEEEVDFDENVKLNRIVLTGVEDQAYSSLELDYSAGSYVGYKAYYTGIKGENFASEEVDVSTSNQIQKVVYSGMTSTPYSSVEEDYSNGALSDEIYYFTDVTGQNYYAYKVTEDAKGNPLSEVFDLNNGAHTQIALASGQTLTSQGNDKFTGSGTGSTTFVLNPIYGADTITNLTSEDTVVMSQSEFEKFSALQDAAFQSGANVLITAADGDTLTLKNMTLATLGGMSRNFTFSG